MTEIQKDEPQTEENPYQITIRWDVSDVMRAFPDIDYHEAVKVLHQMSAHWKPREIGLLRQLCIEAKAHDGEPRKVDSKDWGVG